MPIVIADRVKVTTTTTGTGTLTLGAAVTGFQDFGVIGDGNETYYTISVPGGADYEVGIGTFTASGTTLSRDTILASSNGGSAVNFSAGTKDVFVTYPAEKAVYFDAADAVSIDNLKFDGNAITSTNTDGNIDLTPNGTGEVNISKVDIAGGEIDGTTIGAATPSTGAFTDFTASGTASFTSTGALKIPVGTQGQRPGSPVAGDLRFNDDIDEFEGYNGTAWGAIGGAFTSGTLMLFQQTSAPTGWTKQTTHNNKALRVVSGSASSGGSVGFTTAFASQAVNGSIGNTTAGGSVNISGGSVGSYTLTTADIPGHTHSTTLPVWGGCAGLTAWGQRSISSPTSTITSASTGSGGGHGHSFSAPTGSFTGTAHNHTFTGTAINLAVSYVDLIIASKD
jgi:hypothetical protein